LDVQFQLESFDWSQTVWPVDLATVQWDCNAKLDELIWMSPSLQRAKDHIKKVQTKRKKMKETQTSLENFEDHDNPYE